MRYRALATDYDGTLAAHGAVDEATVEALKRLRASGRKLLLVTGREVADLRRVFPQMTLCDCVVAENGALLYDPATDRERLLCSPAPQGLVTVLRAQCVPVSAGRAVVATIEPYAAQVQAAIARTGLDLQVALNKGSIMVLPTGVNKVSGLLSALEGLRLRPEDVVGVGDAENDVDFLGVCGCAVAVSNALPAVKLRANLLTAGDHGAGVVELIDRLIADDLAACDTRRASE